MGNLHDKTVKKLIKEKSSVRHSDGDGLYLMTPKRGDAYWMLRYTTPATKLRRECVFWPKVNTRSGFK